MFESARVAWALAARTGGCERNAEYVASLVEWNGATEVERALFTDPQTSGGLLVAVPAGVVDDYLSRVPGAVVIGDVLSRGDRAIVLV